MLTHNVSLQCGTGLQCRTEGSAAPMTYQPTRTAPDGESSEAVGRDSCQITRSLILRTALGIIDHDGVDALSMRRLSDAVTATRRCSTGTSPAKPPCSTVSPRSS